MLSELITEVPVCERKRGDATVPPEPQCLEDGQGRQGRERLQKVQPREISWEFIACDSHCTKVPQPVDLPQCADIVAGVDLPKMETELADGITEQCGRELRIKA